MTKFKNILSLEPNSFVLPSVFPSFLYPLLYTYLSRHSPPYLYSIIAAMQNEDVFNVFNLPSLYDKLKILVYNFLLLR